MKTLPLGNRTLRQGHYGADVLTLQQRIGAPADGSFGPRTEAALVAWQQEQGLLADGVAGPATFRALGVLEPLAAPVFTPVTPRPELAPLTEKIEHYLATEGVGDARGWAPIFAEEMVANDIVGRNRASNFVANIVHETRLSALVENLHYTTAARLMSTWPSRFPTVDEAAPFLRNGPALAERVYGGRMGNVNPGDGWLNRGRGGIMVTGQNNYDDMARVTGIPVEQLREELTTRRGAIRISALWWARNGINRICDEKDATAVRIAVNGGRIGLQDVLNLQGRAKPFFA